MNTTLPPISRRIIDVLIVLGVFAFVVATQRSGFFQSLEFKVYDTLIRGQPSTSGQDPIVLVEMTEEDIQRRSLTHPIQDDQFAKLLLLLEAGEPAVVGLDIWRDVPVPASGIYMPLLNSTLLSHSNIIATFTLGGISPPAILTNQPERLGFNDCVLLDREVDRKNPLVRRTLLMAGSGAGETYCSLPFRLALSYLENRGTVVSADPSDSSSLQLGKMRLHPLQSTDGAYFGADVAGWQMLLNFREPKQFTRYSFTEVMEGRLPQGSLQGRIVLVGVTAPSIPDVHSTPIRHDHRGIEIVALVTGQLLRMASGAEQVRRFVPDWIEDGWVLLWCCIGGMANYLAHTRVRLALLITGLLIAVGGCTIMAFGAGWWLPLVEPGFGCLLAAGCIKPVRSVCGKWGARSRLPIGVGP